MAILRKSKLPWFPAIDPDACRADLRCMSFCPQEVFVWNRETGRPTVAHPQRCLPGCQICVDVCQTGALTLPERDEFQSAMERLRQPVDKRHLYIAYRRPETPSAAAPNRPGARGKETSN